MIWYPLCQMWKKAQTRGQCQQKFLDCRRIYILILMILWNKHFKHYKLVHYSLYMTFSTMIRVILHKIDRQLFAKLSIVNKMCLQKDSNFFHVCSVCVNCINQYLYYNILSVCSLTHILSALWYPLISSVLIAANIISTITFSLCVHCSK